MLNSFAKLDIMLATADSKLLVCTSDGHATVFLLPWLVLRKPQGFRGSHSPLVGAIIMKSKLTRRR